MNNHIISRHIFLCCIAFITVLCNEPVGNTRDGYISIGNNDSLYYRIVGNGSQKIIVPMGLWLYDDFKSLADSIDCTLVFYDVRNRGRSTSIADSTRIGIWQDVQDVETVRNYFGFQKISLIGWSYLGMMVMLYATDHVPFIDKIVQIGPVPLQWNNTYPVEDMELSSNIDSVEAIKTERLFKRDEKTKYTKVFTEQWAKTFIFPDLFGDSTFTEKYQPWLLSMVEPENEWYPNFTRHIHHHFGGSVQQLKTDSLWPIIEKIPIPVLTIHGKKDRNAPFGSGKEWATRLNRAKLVVIQGAGHLPWIENSDLVMSSIRVFLSQKYMNQ